VDIDGDGHLDILSGSYSSMDRDEAGLLFVLYGKPDGTFRKAEVLKGTDGRPLTIPAKGSERRCTRPFAVDWDGDGHLDLVVGNFSGTFYWFKGQGKGKFLPKPELIKAGGEPLRIKGRHSDPFVIDWDGDGSLDLVSGSSDGGVYWARNKAGKGKVPDLEPFRLLIKPGQKPLNAVVGRPDWVRESDLTGPMRATRVWVADVNGDGKLDLLVGDCVTLVSPAKGIADAEFRKKYAKWEKDLKTALAGDSARDAKSRKKAADEFDKVYRRRTKFMNEDQTGFVWLYLQK
jgi:hypothetical protein